MDHHPSAAPELPTLGPGIQLLDGEGRSLGPLQSLVLDHVLLHDGPAYWIDAHGHARTTGFARLAPDMRVLDRIHVARGFTPFQHYAIVETLGGRALDRASLIVAPALDAFYRDDPLDRSEGREMHVRALAVLAGVARRYEIPVLVTRTCDDAFAAPIANAAADVIEVRRTRLGPRFVGGGFETLVYPTGRGPVQTTLAFWERVLAAREPLYDLGEPASPEVTVRG